MKNYIITIIGTAVLCGAIHILTPQNWVKYIKIITGLVILSVIASPLSSLIDIDIFSDFSIEESEINANVQTDAVVTELKKRVESDINERIKNELHHDAISKVQISVNENHEITGITEVKIETDADKEKVKKLVSEVYGVNKEEVEIYEP